jgi:hypothetical protein
MIKYYIKINLHQQLKFKESIYEKMSEHELASCKFLVQSLPSYQLTLVAVSDSWFLPFSTTSPRFLWSTCSISSQLLLLVPTGFQPGQIEL